MRLTFVIQLFQEIFSALVIVHVVCCSWCFILQYEQRGHDDSASVPHVHDVSTAYLYGYADDRETPISGLRAIRSGVVSSSTMSLHCNFSCRGKCSW